MLGVWTKEPNLGVVKSILKREWVQLITLEFYNIYHL